MILEFLFSHQVVCRHGVRLRNARRTGPRLCLLVPGQGYGTIHDPWRRRGIENGSNYKDDLEEIASYDALLAKASETICSVARWGRMKKMRDAKAKVSDVTAVVKREASCYQVQLRKLCESVSFAEWGGRQSQNAQADRSDFGGGEAHAQHFA